MRYGVMVNGEFEDRELVEIKAKGFDKAMLGREGTYDNYVMKEINASYGVLDVEDKIVLDIGANIGCFSVWAAEHGAAEVIAVEPETQNYQMMLLNTDGWKLLLDIDDLNNDLFRLHNAALTVEDVGSIDLHLSPTGKNPGNTSTTPRRGRTSTRVDALSIGELFRHHPRIDVLKMDCEGGEFELLPELIKHKHLKQIVLEYHINGFGVEKVQALHDTMVREGWTVTKEPRIEPNLWQTIGGYSR
tara:strand:+ start:234 stop:968 length:735 start_codon:yes stop_codon:yes gene_type:complete